MSALLKLQIFRRSKTEERNSFSPLLYDLKPEPESEPRVTHRVLWTSIFVHVSLILLYTLVAFIIIYRSIDCHSLCHYTPTIQSPAQEAVFYETVSINTPLGEKSLFTGEPRQELEDAWYDILKYQNIRVTKSELDAINRTSIPLNDAQAGYLANLDVFHELHCLNVIREHVYREYYPDKHSKALQLQHVDHCIDTLRQTMMCHADISLLTYTWIDDYRWPWPRFEIDHECRSWESVLNWTKARYIPRLLGPIVAHPVLGISWRGDEADEA